MEGYWKARKQETTTCSSLQGRDGHGVWRSTDQGDSHGWSEESPQPRAESSQTKIQIESGARRVWRHASRIDTDETVNSDSILHCDSKDLFRVIYTNARSLIGKIDILKAYVYDLKPSVICITEACTNSSISDAFVGLDGYNLTVRADGTDTKDGWCRGLLLYVRSDIVAAKFESSIVESLVECEGVTVPWGDKELLTLILAYRPPRPPGSLADNGYCDKICDLISSLKSPAILLGDLNLPGIDWDLQYAFSAAEKKVLETVQNCFWTQNIDFATRKDPGSGAESLLEP